MAEFTFYYNPMSRAQIARWALHEIAAEYDPVLIGYEPEKPAEFLAANAMGKIPTLVHHASDGDHVITECAAICHYCAAIRPDAGLLPTQREQADYFRWMFFAAGPLEQALTCKAMGWEPTPKQEMTVGFGSYDRAVNALAGWFEGRDYVCGERFTAADIYVGSAVLWGTQFETLPRLPVFTAYADRCAERAAYKEAKAIDMGEIAAMQAEKGG